MQVTHVALVGTGVIGASWAALFLAKGLDVVATDVAPDAEPRLRAFVDQCWPALEELGLAPGASRVTGHKQCSASHGQTNWHVPAD